MDLMARAPRHRPSHPSMRLRRIGRCLRHDRDFSRPGKGKGLGSSTI
jgi:hypothetical protein